VLAVAAVLAGIVTGGYLAADALGRPVGGTISVGPSVRVRPLPGWELARRFTDPQGIRLTSGSGNLDIVALPFAGDDVELLRGYVDGVLAPDAEQLRVSEVEPVRLASGLSGSRIAYVGLFGDVHTPIEGEVTAVLSPSGTGVAFDGWAPAGQLQYVSGEIDAMIEAAEIA
jgi:hypothetical protein